MTRCGILYNSQYGFRPNCSTIDAITEFTARNWKIFTICMLSNSYMSLWMECCHCLCWVFMNVNQTPMNTIQDRALAHVIWKPTLIWCIGVFCVKDLSYGRNWMVTSRVPKPKQISKFEQRGELWKITDVSTHWWRLKILWEIVLLCHRWMNDKYLLFCIYSYVGCHCLRLRVTDYVLSGTQESIYFV